MGRGRHTGILVDAGFRVFGVDNRFDAVKDAIGKARGRSWVLRGWVADLTVFPLPRERFDLIIVTRYLQRDLFPALKAALTPDGAIVYETFTEAQRALLCGPTSPDHLLKPGELRAFFPDFDVQFYEEVTEPEAVARLVAFKRASMHTAGHSTRAAA